ncbi:MAG TPA: hypothetical protein GX736_05930 [Mogibacterium sp.]|nr:hypothetical protein [Mogibacterium sp.]
MKDNTHEMQEQLKAAYALNMCTVSVSQIVDYNDEYILEQEYEAILNNLNLEQIPKDEALLNILVKLLNVITFFRIDKVKRAQIEKKYQRTMKNAIWSAVPNIGVIVAGEPLTVVLSLATQVGIGYMNYRRTKANALADKEDSEIELRITAMEQFNALRRELFTTAWRLADEYKFPDRYRLTERQITQYNEILMDTDEIRKYERLTAVQDKFEAYLPFWYFIGHSAKYISEDQTNGIDSETRNYYRDQAKKHFEKFDGLNSFNILREDELTASFALEYIDLLLLEEKPDKEKIADLIKTAVKMAGNANDILELCAISYLKIGQTEEAEKILRILVNEDYNTATNAKLLSRIYVSQYLEDTNFLAKAQYDILASRVTSAWLFPMPDYINSNRLLQDKELRNQYLSDQRFDLQKEYREVINQFIEKYIILFNRIIPVPDKNAPSEYFRNTESSIRKRRQDVYDALQSDARNEYQRSIRESGYRFRYVELINEMLRALDTLRLFRENDLKEDMIQLIRDNLGEASGNLKEIQEKLNHDDFSIMDYEKIQKSFSFQRLTKEFFDKLTESIMDEIEKAESLDILDDIDLDLATFCMEQSIEERNLNANIKINSSETDDENDYISQDILGEDEQDERFNRRSFEKMLTTVKEASDSIIEDSEKAEILIRGSQEFELYFKNVKLKGDAFKSKTLAVIDDKTRTDLDLFITSDGIVPVKRSKVDKLREFDKLEYQGKSIKLGWPEEYSNRAVNVGNLYNLLERLGKIRKI